jgi:hypothetical protein
MKPTAVQWFFEWMDNNQYFIGNDLLEAFNQAKEMEIQQKEVDYQSGYLDCYTQIMSERLTRDV